MIKKVLQILFLLFLSIRIFGQIQEEYAIENYSTLISNEIKIKPNTTFKNDIQKKVLIDIIQDTNNYFCLGDSDSYNSKKAYNNSLKELFSIFQFIDLDHDNDLDIIFYGYMCVGNESESILIYLNKNGTYHKVLWNLGKFVDFQNYKEFIIYEYPCCANIENSLIKYEIQKDTLIKVFKFTFFNSPILHLNSKEYQNILPKKLKKENDAILMSGAEILFIPKDTIYQSTYIENNLIIKTDHELDISIYAHHTDQKGNIWLYCKLPSQSEDKNGMKNYFFAWTKEQNCKYKPKN
jgi:hypothetical protein